MTWTWKKVAHNLIIHSVDEDIQTLLTELNDTAITALRNEDNDNALECLKRGE